MYGRFAKSLHFFGVLGFLDPGKSDFSTTTKVENILTGLEAQMGCSPKIIVKGGGGTNVVALFL